MILTESQRKRLIEYPHEYLSIGITETGEPRRSISIPWNRTGNAFNMRTPNIYITPDDLADGALWDWLNARKVTGCYIFCPLEDYSFLTRLPHLQDITIHCGGALRDLRFLRELPDWFLLHVEDAVLENLEDLFPQGRKQRVHSYCVCLSGCTVTDISALCRPELRLSELVILAPEGSNDRERWKAVRCGNYSYYEYRVKGK